MSSGPNDLLLFLGRFHPVLVHLPIGGLVLIGTLEVLAKFARFSDAAQSTRLIWGLVAPASIVAAVLGLMLSQSGGYDPQLLRWHKWTGIAVAVACTLTWLLHWRGRLRACRLCLLITLVVLVVASDLGASLTHGRGYLTRFAPGPLRALLGVNRRPAVASGVTPSQAQRGVFNELIHPILQRRCSACHGPEKHKAGLSIESYESLLSGGDDGPVLIPNRPLDSPMIQHLLLPLDDAHHMPPQDKPQPTLAEIAVLEWWIEHGAPADKTVGDLKPGPEMERIISAAQAASK